MTFLGGMIAVDGLERAGRGAGVEMWWWWSLLPFNDLRRDFIIGKDSGVS